MVTAFFSTYWWQKYPVPEDWMYKVSQISVSLKLTLCYTGSEIYVSIGSINAFFVRTCSTSGIGHALDFGIMTEDLSVHMIKCVAKNAEFYVTFETNPQKATAQTTRVQSHKFFAAAQLVTDKHLFSRKKGPASKTFAKNCRILCNVTI